MKKLLNRIAYTAVLGSFVFQQSAIASVVDYTVTGSFYADALEVIQYDEETGDPIYQDATLTGPQPVAISSLFTINFSVDEDAPGDTPLFNPVRLFDNAVSNVSVSINGANVLSSSQTETLQQFPGENGIYSRWGWSLFESLMLPDVSVVVYDDDSSQLTLTPQFINFALYDATDTVYGGGHHSDIITANLGDFTDTEFSIGWMIDYPDDYSGPEPGDFDGEAFYTLYGSINSISSTSEVPLPAAAWMFISAIGGLVLTKRKQRRA